jgi:fibronectin type 3 domain-containing protein
VTVTAVNDSVAEGNHTGTITHTVSSTDGNYSGISVAGVTVYITDNDTPGVQITQSGGSTNVTEGGATDSYTVVLSSQPTANVTVTVTPNSQVSVDKTSLVFTPANWNVAQTVTVTAVNDSVAEGNHTGTITHTVSSTDANYNGISVVSVTAQITDNDTPDLQTQNSWKFDFGTSTSPLEAGYTRVTETTKYSAALKYGWQSGTNGSRDRATGTNLNRDLNCTKDGTFAIDLPNGRYLVEMLLGDTGPYYHDNMGVFLEGAKVDTVSTASGQVLSRSYTVNVVDGQLTVRLKDLGGKDPNICVEGITITSLPPPIPSLWINDLSLTEGNTGTKDFTFTVALSQAGSQPVSVQYATADGTATAGSDYTAASGTLTIPAGQTNGTIVVSVNGDTTIEADETFYVNLSGATGATILDSQGMGTILNDDVPALTVTVNPAMFAENAGSNAATGTVSRQGPTTAALTVTLTSSDTTEAVVPATVTIPAGQSSATFAVAAVDDAIYDGTQSVTIIASAAGFTSGTAGVQVTDDDPPGLSVTIAPATFAENAGNNAATGTVTRQGPTTAALIVTLASSDTTEATVPATVTIPPGQSSATFDVAAVDDAVYDGTQSVSVAATASVYTPGSATIQVTDNEPQPFSAHFDFGTSNSPLEAGYTRVTETTKYNAGLTYGWQSGTISSRDRGTGSNLDRDLNFTSNGTFAVDLPNGRYQVDMILGDTGPYWHDNMGIYLEGIQKDGVSTASGQVVRRSYTVDVLDGQLNLLLKDLGGTDPNVTIEALDIALLELFGN